ncbi:MAG: glycoside hydrolase family 20 zincin-like fold domain-containing protein [Bryobacteraceae bacterium]|nr:glycoside hydrolase family 20 zincin-like fold domain-containing protein [Bryobacteraceae bacterium]MDW8379904.1 glycoside hydrolase family 20 zincin-like fold domain-containing protein [Bryobacterales bacterium]
MFYIKICAPLIFVSCLGAEVDLRHARVEVAEKAAKAEQKALQVLLEEIEKRTQIRLTLGASEPGKPVIRLVRSPAGRPAEGYRLRTSETEVVIEGNDARGLLFGAGHLLRLMKMGRGHLTVKAGIDLATAPKYKLRGHQLGYRPKTNSYDGWTLAMWDQYIRDLAVWGTNAIELIPPRSDDDADSPHFPLPQIDTMVGMSKIIDDYGLDVWIWYPALDKDYSNPATVEFALREWGEVFRRLPRIDHVFVPGGDPGHTQPRYLMALLEKQTANLRRYHPKAQMWVAPQGFSTEWLEEFYELVRREPSWLAGVVYGPQVRVSIAELRRAIPSRYPIRHYPDITHALRAQYGVPHWDLAYALTLGREPINPRPVDQAHIFRATQPFTTGFLTYSEGCNDDVNKIVWSALGWNPSADLDEVLRQYSQYFISPRLAEGFAQGLLALERNWRGPLLANSSVDVTLQQFQVMEREATPAERANWRFQQALYRAYYDAYIRRRLLHETAAEDRALEALRRGSVEEADEILEKASRQEPAASLRSRVFELAEALFQSIRMQLSVAKYQAIAVGRGANLDSIDVPLSNAPWIRARLAEIRNMNPTDRRKAMEEILNWTNPGPGGFYDDLGNPAMQPHLVERTRYEEDPARLVGALIGFAINPDTRIAPWRTSWLRHAEALNDAKLKMEYRHLDPQARYRVRVTYAGENLPHPIRLTADGQYEIHGFLERPRPVKPLEFDIPREATADGILTLEWEKPKGAGGHGRGAQVSEVWLLVVR